MCRILKHLFGTDLDSAASNKDLIIATLSLCRTVAKTENNKSKLTLIIYYSLFFVTLIDPVNVHVLFMIEARLMKVGIGALLTELIVAKNGEFADWVEVLQEACQLIRGLCLHDDLRKDMSSAYDNGKFFTRQNGLVPGLIALSSTFRTSPSLASAALLSARNLITTEEAVQVMAQHGALALIHEVLSCNFDDFPEECNASVVSLVRSAIGVMRNVCADDKRKNKLVGDGTLDLLVNTMSSEMYAKDAVLMEHAMACLAAISLRSPSNSQRIARTGRALEIMAATMRRYSDKSGLLRQGCLTVRNIAARCPELRQVLLDAGMEEIMRGCGRFMDVVDEAYAALRDLGCEVQYVKVSADGTVAPAYEQFGATPKLQFNPVFEDSDNIEQRMVEEARAPFAESSPSAEHVHDESCQH